jgi:polyisoprenoid-binding protein YceI
MNFKIQRGVVEIKGPDATARLSRLEGTLEFDPDDESIALGELTIDMRALDAGDQYKNWKLATDVDAASHPKATVTLVRIDDLHEEIAGRYRGAVTVQIQWRGHAAQVKVKGQATVDRRGVEASGSGELAVRDLGAVAPRFLLPPGTDRVSFHVSLLAYAIPSS